MQNDETIKVGVVELNVSSNANPVYTETRERSSVSCAVMDGILIYLVFRYCCYQVADATARVTLEHISVFCRGGAHFKNGITDALAVTARTTAPGRDKSRQLSLVYILRYLFAHGLAW